jgi:Flp pilus assembly protein TadG
MRSVRSTADRRPAAAAVELAVVMPVLLILLIGVWEIGRLIQLQQIMNNAARAGARLASQGTILTSGSIVQVPVTGGSQNVTPNVTTTVSQYLQASGIQNLSGLQVSFQFLNGDTTQTQPYAGTKNQQFVVQATMPYANLKWTNLSLINPTTLSGQCVWQCMADDPITVSSALPGWSP